MASRKVTLIPVADFLVRRLFNFLYPRWNSTCSLSNLVDMARFCRERLGRACPLCPGISDVNLFRYRKRVIHLNTEVSDGAFDFGVPEQELHGS